MARRRVAIASDGSFELGGNAYLIPAEFSAREVYSYRRLMEPIPDIPGGTSLNARQRKQQHAYFLRRAAACIIPGLQVKSLEGLPLGQLENMHEWIVAHRPDLSEAVQLHG
ncbi:MAG: hypothetical protein MJB57_17355 [Gemmatimonadetes bacterium]|nr:hypothetical protein [Gemmatimonadota bacterium]